MMNKGLKNPMIKQIFCLVSFFFLICPCSPLAITETEIPSDAVNDAIMANPGEIQEIMNWAVTSFTGDFPAYRKYPVKVQVKRQDHGDFNFNLSCLNTPIVIGKEHFEHGLGTHANSEIVVAVPAGAAIFNASIGIDNNYNTQGTKGSVRFHIDMNGAEIFQSPVLHGGDAPIPVNVQFPDTATEIVLKVDTTDDGPGWDQADWANACFLTKQGKTIWLDDNQKSPFLHEANPPFSFTYDKLSSIDLLPKWKQQLKSEDLSDRVKKQIQWSDEKTGLQVTADLTIFKSYPAAEWILYFENQGKEDTPVIENIQALDLNIGNVKKMLPSFYINYKGMDATKPPSFPMIRKLNQSKVIIMRPQAAALPRYLRFRFIISSIRIRG